MCVCVSLCFCVPVVSSFISVNFYLTAHHFTVIIIIFTSIFNIINTVSKISGLWDIYLGYEFSMCIKWYEAAELFTIGKTLEDHLRLPTELDKWRWASAF